MQARSMQDVVQDVYDLANIPRYGSGIKRPSALSEFEVTSSSQLSCPKDPLPLMSTLPGILMHIISKETYVFSLDDSFRKDKAFK